jgi:hypothetical protein
MGLPERKKASCAPGQFAARAAPAFRRHFLKTAFLGIIPGRLEVPRKFDEKGPGGAKGNSRGFALLTLGYGPAPSEGPALRVGPHPVFPPLFEVLRAYYAKMQGMMHFGLFLLLLIQSDRPAPVPGMPAAPGVYFRQNDAQWAKMETAAMADMKSKGMGNFLDTAGLTNLSVTVTYLGAQAKLRIPPGRPAFYVRGAGSPKDAMIVRLARGKDTRAAQTDSSLAGIDNRAGFRRDQIQSATVTVFADSSFAVIPEQELKPGEYALVFGFANAAYDFSITRATK